MIGTYYGGNEIALGIFEEMKNEINLYKKFSYFFGVHYNTKNKLAVKADI